MLTPRMPKKKAALPLGNDNIRISHDAYEGIRKADYKSTHNSMLKILGDKMNSEERAADTAERNRIETEGYKLRTLRVDDPRWNGAKARARREGMSLSAWLRGMIDKALTKKTR